MILVSILAGLCALSHVALGDHVKNFGPSKDVARRHSPQIFNAVHNAMRQWGSSVHHNGMSMFLATVPEGVLFHHGNDRPETPSEPDWLAYEVEHAEGFAHGFSGPPEHKKPPPDRKLGRSSYDQKVMGSKVRPSGRKAGWLHVYRTSRPLQFLYVDGMSGGKTFMGTLDTQDYLLRGDRSYGAGGREVSRAGGGPMNERLRAAELCELCDEWGLHGIIRMEAGFEIIQCNFTDGLEQIQALQRPGPSGQPGHGRGIQSFEYLRGIAERYFDIGSSRTIIDYSSMVSAFFFPVNLTNPDANRPDLPRLSNTTDAELAAIKEYFKKTLDQRRNEPRRPIDWQDVSDIIVSRYADRVDYMVNAAPSTDAIAAEISFLIDLYVDYSRTDENSRPDAIDRCTNFYLKTVTAVSEPDQLIFEAFKGVTSKICTTLFEVRDLITSSESSDESPLQTATKKLQSLMDFLAWARFRQCSGCGRDEVCVIPMWPFGAEDDYFHPRCGNSSDLSGSKNYWSGLRRP